MRKATLVVLSLPLLLGAASSPEEAVVDRALAALGGVKASAAKTLVHEGEGVTYNLGQDLTPGARTQTYAITGYRSRVDLALRRMRVEQTRTPNFPYYAGQQPQRLIAGIDGEVAYDVAANGRASRASAAVAQDRRAELYHHPLALVQAAKAPGAQIRNARVAGAERLVDVVTPDGVALTLVIDAATSRPARITSRSYHPNLGDVVITTRFSDYQPVAGLTLPARWTSAIDDFVTAEMRATRQAVDGEVKDLAAPAEAASAAAPAPVPTVTAEELAPGVWWLAGGSHHSALVEFKDSLMLFEAPQSEARTLAVIAKARELRPGKPLTHVVNTHHHFDHTAGIRAAVSEGLTVVTQAGNAAFFEEMAKRPHTLVADALAKKPAALELEAVTDAKTFDDGAMTVTIYHVAGNPHSHTMLMAHLPKQRLLIEVDAFTPGSAVSPYSPNLLENVRKRNLAVDRVVPLHSTIAPFSQLETVAAGGKTP